MLELRMAKELIYFRDEDGDHFLEVDIESMSLESAAESSAAEYGEPMSTPPTSGDRRPDFLAQLGDAGRWLLR
jgi:hypothetical protein